MSMDLPPEAFTKETLQAAFNWLQDQPEPVKASVHTPERLVSLYRKAQRTSDLDAPVSSKRFIDELKSLRNSLDQFSNNDFPTHSPQDSSLNFEAKTSSPPPPPPLKSEPLERPQETKASPTNSSASLSEYELYSGATHKTATETETRKATIELTHQKQRTTHEVTDLDPLSQSRVKQVRDRFNLSSDGEALRILVSLGFEKFSEFN
jgi:hypothetical protein